MGFEGITAENLTSSKNKWSAENPLEMHWNDII